MPLPSERGAAPRARARAPAAAAEAERECGGRDARVPRGDATRGGAGVARRAAAVEAAWHVGARLRPQLPPRMRSRSSVPLNLPLLLASIMIGFSNLLLELIVWVTWLICFGAVGFPAIAERCRGVHCRGAGGRDHNVQWHTG